MITKHIFISGRVQGVGFRHFTRRNANELGITGWVTNLEDRRVEAVLQGQEKAVQLMIEKIESGPAYSDVVKIEQEVIESEIFSTFNVRY